MDVNIALLTVTDTRTFDNDKSGAILVKKIPPPIPTMPDIKPIIDPKEIEINLGILLILICSLLKDLLSINKKMPATNKTQNNKVSNKLFSIFIDPPIKAKGMEPIK